jgi:1-acyl-sn-glycerol-3-phosphate acyltransferase
MALEAQVPVIPLILWGAQRMWTKDHPKTLGRAKIPLLVRAGEPLAPVGTADELDATLRAAMTVLLHEVQERYPHPPGAFWVPRRLGGSAPTPAEAARLEEAELAQRARRSNAEPA